MPGHLVGVDNGMDVYRHYIADNVPLRKKIPSPLRDDKDPSFSIYPHRSSGEIYFTDHGTGKWGNHWSFVQELFGIDFKAALDKVKVDILKMSKNDLISNIRPVYSRERLSKSSPMTRPRSYPISAHGMTLMLPSGQDSESPPRCLPYTM